MACLLYCITQPMQPVTLSTGVGDSPVQSSDLAGLRVYWSELPDAEALLANPEALKKAALQFHQVLREVLTATSPLPFRFPTLLESADALGQHLAAEQELYRAALERIGDAVQYEITAIWADEQPADTATPVSGREYLKRRQQAAGRINAVEEKLKTVAADSVREWRARRERKGHRWFALVPRQEREHFIASLKNAGPSQGVRLRLSGPWPPSEFMTPRGEHG